MELDLDAFEMDDSGKGTSHDSPNFNFRGSDSSILCEHCKYVFDHWQEVVEDEYQVRFPHCENVFALQASAGRGCALCGLLLRNLDERGELEILHDATIGALNDGLSAPWGSIRIMKFSRIISSWKVDDFQDCRLLELRFRVAVFGKDEEMSESSSDDESSKDKEDSDDASDPGVRLEDEFVAKVTILPVPSEEPQISAVPRTLSANSQDTLSLAKKWLENCSQLHLSCNIPQPSVPTRLISLKGDMVRIITSSSLTFMPQYATLSHCWGSLKLIQLTTRNQDMLHAGIPVNFLCKTFKEAIYFTQQLGLQYIWIDSMCIIQDDPTDWAKESKLMASVYGSSHINLAATSAVDGNGGLFFHRDPTHVWRHRVKVIEDVVERHYDCIEDGIYDTGMFRTPLAERAWAIQERLLAPRTLHFSSAQLFWECNSSNACEIFPEEFPDFLKKRDFYINKQPISRAWWAKIVQIYSLCKLTYSKDKLVAIAGIAKEIHNQEPQNEYCAGLWRQDMEIQLLWKARSPTEKPTNPRAPTWSWAAVDGIISYARFINHAWELEGNLYIKVWHLRMWPYEPFGEVPDAKLRLKCDFLVRGKFVKTGKSIGSEIVAGSRSYKFRTNLDYLEIQETVVYLLPICDFDASLASVQDRGFRGLLLQPSGTERGTYQRIGHFEYWDFDNNGEDLEQVCRSAECQAEPFEYESYEADGEGNIQRLIRLI